MWNLLKKFAKRLLFGFGILVILLAIALGTFRVLIAQIPSYQAELQAWVAEELGVVVDFGELDARLSLRGPELTLHDARIGNGPAGDAFLSADRAAVTLDPLMLLLERKPRMSRLTLEGVRLTVERARDGRLRIQGIPAVGSDIDLEALLPSQAEVTVRDSRINFVDELRDHDWQFEDVTISLDRAPDGLVVGVRARPPAALASRVELSLEAHAAAPNAPLEWNLVGDLRETDLGALALLAPGPTAYAVQGTGDVSVRVDWSVGRVSRAMATLGLRDIVLPKRDDEPGVAPFERLRLTAEWDGDTAGGWQLALSDVELVHAGHRWPAGGNTMLSMHRRDGEVDALALRSDYLRVDDIADIARSLPPLPAAEPWLEPWLELDPRGELEDVDFVFAQMAGDWDYSLAGKFTGLGLESTRGRPGFSGLSGELKSDARNGTIVFSSANVGFDWPRVFPQALAADSLTGTVVWRQGRNVVRVVSSDLTVGVLDSAARSSLELTLPLDGTSPRLDMETVLPEVDLVAAKRYLPTRIMPDSVVAWLDQAIQGGKGSDVEFSFYGALADFPFDHGEGQFHVGARIHDARLDYAADWPSAEGLSGAIEFTNASFLATGSGRVLGNRGTGLRIGIEDMRRGVLTLAGTTDGPLAEVVSFLRAAPQIAEHLGPGYERLRVHGGDGAVGMHLTLPLLDVTAYDFKGSLAIADADLSVDGFSPHATDVNGVLAIDGSAVTAEGIAAGPRRPASSDPTSPATVRRSPSTGKRVQRPCSTRSSCPSASSSQARRAGRAASCCRRVKPTSPVPRGSRSSRT